MERSASDGHFLPSSSSSRHHAPRKPCRRSPRSHHRLHFRLTLAPSLLLPPATNASAVIPTRNRSLRGRYEMRPLVEAPLAWILRNGSKSDFLVRLFSSLAEENPENNLTTKILLEAQDACLLRCLCGAGCVWCGISSGSEARAGEIWCNEPRRWSRGRRWASREVGWKTRGGEARGGSRVESSGFARWASNEDPRTPGYCAPHRSGHWKGQSPGAGKWGGGPRFVICKGVRRGRAQPVWFAGNAVWC